MQLLVGGGAAAIAAAINQKVLVDGPAKAEAEAAKAGKTAEEIKKASAIPETLRSGWGRVLTNAGIGLGLGILMDTMSKKGGPVQRNAGAVALGFVGYAASLAVHDVIRKTNEKEEWFIAAQAQYLNELQNPTPEPAGALFNARSAEALAMQDVSAGVYDVGALMDSPLPYSQFSGGTFN